MMQDSFHEDHQGRTLLAWREIAWIDIEDNILKEILKLDFFVVREVSDKLGDESGIEDDFLDDVDDALMVILEECCKFSHLYKVYLFFLYFSFKTKTILKLTKLLHQLQSFLIVLFDTSCDLSLFYYMCKVYIVRLVDRIHQRSSGASSSRDWLPLCFVNNLIRLLNSLILIRYYTP